MICKGNILRKNRLVFLNGRSFFNAATFLSPFDAIPTGLYRLCDQSIVQNDETEDMIPRQSNQGAESQGKKHGKGKIFQHLLGDPLCEKFREYTLSLRFFQKSVPPKRHPVGRVMILLYVAEMDRVGYKIPEKCRAEVKEPFPEGFFGDVTFPDYCQDLLFQFVVQRVDEHILILKIPIDGAHRHPGLLRDHRHRGAVKPLLGDQLQSGLYDLVPFIRCVHGANFPPCIRP